MRIHVLFATVALCAMSAPVSWAEPATTAETQAKILAATPGYDPAIRAEAEAQKAKENLDEAEIVVLPEMTVQEKSLRRMEDETLYRKGAWDKELTKRELSEFDRFLLNRYTLSVGVGGVSFGIAGAQSAADRAREAYIARKNQEFKDRVNNFSDVLKSTDDKESNELKTLMLDTAKSGSTLENNARPSNWR